MANAVGTYYDDDSYGSSVAQSPATVRAQFVKRTYGHVAGAVLALVGIEAALFMSGVGQDLALRLFQSNIAYLALLIAFIGGGFVAKMLAHSTRSVAVQYGCLVAYVLLEAAILLPLLYVAERFFPGQQLAEKAGIITLAVFGGLTAGVFISGKDLSFLGPVLWIGSFALLGVVLAGVLFPATFTIGSLLIPAAGVILSAIAILYHTSNVMHHYGPHQYVAASLALFASVATMFYNILMLLMGSRSD